MSTQVPFPEDPNEAQRMFGGTPAPWGTMPSRRRPSPPPEPKPELDQMEQERLAMLETAWRLDLAHIVAVRHLKALEEGGFDHGAAQQMASHMYATVINTMGTTDS